jgi:hypothetical protein
MVSDYMYQGTLSPVIPPNYIQSDLHHRGACLFHDMEELPLRPDNVAVGAALITHVFVPTSPLIFTSPL